MKIRIAGMKLTSHILQVSLNGFLVEEMVCGWAFLQDQYSRMLQGTAFFPPCRCFTINSFAPDVKIVGTCLVSNDTDIFLEVLTLNNSSFAHTLVMSKHGA